MRIIVSLMISLFLLSSCATMESAWEGTKDASKSAYDWVVGDDGDDGKK